MCSSDLSSSVQLNSGAHSSASTRVTAHRSPSRTRSVNPGIMRVEQNTYSSPCARSMVPNMFSPQVPAPPPVFAANRCSTSMTSSNAAPQAYAAPAEPKAYAAPASPMRQQQSAATSNGLHAERSDYGPASGKSRSVHTSSRVLAPPGGRCSNIFG